MCCQTYCRADILLLLKHPSPVFPLLITIHSFIPLLQSAPGCYCNPLFNMAITTVQTNLAIDQNSWAKTAQAPLSYPEYCSQSTKLQSCAYSCPTYQLGAHKKFISRSPGSGTPFCTVKQRVQPCHITTGIHKISQYDSEQEMELSEGSISSSGSNKPAQLQHMCSP